MNLKHLLMTTALFVAGATASHAQCLLPDALVQTTKEQMVVKEVPYIDLHNFGKREPEALKPTAAEANPFGESAIKTAMQYLGCRYVHGAAGPHVFDCSGFTSFIYGRHNVKITRSSRDQYTLGRAVRTHDLRTGDLVFFSGRKISRTVGHVGIVKDVNPEDGTFTFVHASIRGVKVSKSTESYYSCRYIGARRIVE